VLAERILPPDIYEKFSNIRIGDSGSWRVGVPFNDAFLLTMPLIVPNTGSKRNTANTLLFSKSGKH
jgi:hypothetical protein